MAGLVFIQYPDASLSRPAVSRPVDSELRRIGVRLLSALRQAGAYGLAGAHIGEIAPVIALDLKPNGPVRDDRAFYNPQIIACADEVEAGREGSVSLPGIEVVISRPVWVDLAFDDDDGIAQIMRLEGFPARCAMHETEQAQGIFFLEKLSRLKRESAIRKYAKARRHGR